MSGEMEAAGAMATAGLAAGAIEGRETREPGEGGCLNCGAALNGPYCAQCGQAAHARRSLVHVLGEFLHSLFHFDTKVWRTLPMVLFRPGTLTRNYVYGKRARYVSPLAFFLLAVFFMFAVFAFSGGPPVNINETGSVAEAQASLDEARQDLVSAETELRDVTANPDPDQPAGLEVSLARNAISLAQAEVARREASLRRAEARETAAETPAPAVESGEPAAPPADTTPAAPAAPDQPGAVEIGVGDSLTWQDIARQIGEDEDFVLIHGWDALNENARATLRNPDLAAYRVQEAASKFSFLLVPISLPFIALLFLWKRGLTFYDHVVYALYALSFASLLFVAILIAARVDWLFWFIPTAILVGIPVHTYFHLKGAYALGWWSAAWRTFFMMIFAIIALSIFLVAIIILGLTG